MKKEMCKSTLQQNNKEQNEKRENKRNWLMSIGFSCPITSLFLFINPSFFVNKEITQIVSIGLCALGLVLLSCSSATTKMHNKLGLCISVILVILWLITQYWKKINYWWYNAIGEVICISMLSMIFYNFFSWLDIWQKNRNDITVKRRISISSLGKGVAGLLTLICTILQILAFAKVI